MAMRNVRMSFSPSVLIAECSKRLSGKAAATRGAEAYCGSTSRVQASKSEAGSRFQHSAQKKTPSIRERTEDAIVRHKCWFSMETPLSPNASKNNIGARRVSNLFPESVSTPISMINQYFRKIAGGNFQRAWRTAPHKALTTIVRTGADRATSFTTRPGAAG